MWNLSTLRKSVLGLRISFPLIECPRPLTANISIYKHVCILFTYEIRMYHSIRLVLSIAGILPVLVFFEMRIQHQDDSHRMPSRLWCWRTGWWQRMALMRPQKESVSIAVCRFFFPRTSFNLRSPMKGE